MDDDLGLRFRSLRELHGLSQRALARQTGVSHATVSLIEQGRMSPSIGVLKKLLLGLGMSVADFFAMETSPEPRPFFSSDELAELTDYPIQKNKQMLNLMFRLGLQQMYGPATEKVRQSYFPFLRSCPLAVRLPGGVLVTHSIEEATFVGQRILVLNHPPNNETVIVENPHPINTAYKNTFEYKNTVQQLHKLVEG